MRSTTTRKPGPLELVAVLRFFGADELLVSEADLLDGLARSLIS